MDEVKLKRFVDGYLQAILELFTFNGHLLCDAGFDIDMVDMHSFKQVWNQCQHFAEGSFNSFRDIEETEPITTQTSIFFSLGKQFCKASLGLEEGFQNNSSLRKDAMGFQPPKVDPDKLNRVLRIEYN